MLKTLATGQQNPYICARSAYAADKGPDTEVNSDVNKDWTCKDKDKDKDQAYKDQDKDKD